MNDLNYFPFYYELIVPANASEMNEIKNDKNDIDITMNEWQQEYELINLSHQLEYGW